MANSLLAFVVSAGISLIPTSINSYYSDGEYLCLAKNIYHEAKNQSYSGMLAVGQVTINRVQSDYWPDTICDVVYEGAHKPYKCQFSWTCDKKQDYVSVTSKEWQKAMSAAYAVLSKSVDVVEDATHFHADYVKPYWADKLELVTKIDNHIFYKETR